ncbi:MAG TPA: two-component regulator propeller domain-containing protein [Chitinophagaceae bacterium]|nr:two-component regulator propeller domain-containing protein [Chitinophagaceae bacterium]
MRPFVSYIWFSFLLFICQSVHSQQLLFENYSSEQGLSQLSCYAIAQDSDGFMWFGTQDGLNRYDGREFKVYSRQTDAGKKLPSNAIFALYFDTTHQSLWVGTASGLGIYHSEGDSMAKFSDFFPFAADLEKLPVKKIVSFQKNEYWIITFNKGIYCLNTQSASLRSFFAEEKIRSSVTDIILHNGKIIVSLLYNLYELRPAGPSYQPLLLHEDYQFPQIEALASFHNKIWIGTISDGCYYINDPVEKKENIVASDIVFGGVFCFGVDNQNELWIGSRGSGIYKYNAATNTVTRAIHNQFVPTSPSANFVVNLFKDRQGIMWCGLSGGLAKYDPLRYQFGHVNGPTSLKGSLIDKAIYRMYTARNGAQFIGTQNRGLFEWNRTANEFINYPETAVVGKANNVIYDITEDDLGNLWAATCGGLMQLERETKKVSYFSEKRVPVKLNKMYAIIKLKKADSLLVAADDGLHFFSLKDRRWVSFPHEPENAELVRGFASFRGGRYFYEDDDNTLWLCASGSGLIRYRYLKNELEPVKVVNQVSPSVRHLLVDGTNFLLATDNGLLVYDHKKNKLVKWLETKADGISNVCYAIQKDDEGFYWVSTNSGLCKINSQFQTVQKYNSGNGLAFQEYNTACTVRDPDGTLYFGGMGGITYFNSSNLQQNEFSPAPLITAIKINNEPRALHINPAHAKELKLSHTENFLTIRFAVTNFSNEANNVFSYRLKGLNDKWSAATTSNVASFTSLPPGNYIFELRSANSDGKWSDGVKTIAITIRPPWWQTWWFRAAALLVLSSLIIYFVRKRIRTIRHEANLKQKIAETEMMALRAQMNPHFIFNSLNSIREMILNNENKEASRYLSKFAHLMRITLDQSSQSFVSLRGTLDYLHRYIEMEQIRNGHFSYTIDVDKTLDTDETVLPPMLIQPFIENAIWHGTADDHRNININIGFKKQNNQLVCIIDDNGIGIKQSLQNKNGDMNGHHSVGIANIKNRIHLLNEEYKLQSSVTIEDKSKVPGNDESGTLITLRLPLEIAEE